MPADFDPSQFAALMIVLFLGIGVHEYAHCKVADMCGDPTPAFYGRVTLNLFKHFDPLGAIMIVMNALYGVGLGWGKPAPCNDSKMDNPRWDGLACAAAGPLSNIIQAGLYAIAMKFFLGPGTSTFVATLLVVGVFANVSLAVFNLIPFGPLDGHWIVGYLIPDERVRLRWFRFHRSIGFMGFFLIIIILNSIASNGGPDVIGSLVRPPSEFLIRLMMGT